MTSLDSDTVALLSKRAFDVAASTRGVKVYLNGKLLPIKNFKDYVDLCLKVRLIHPIKFKMMCDVRAVRKRVSIMKWKANLK